MLRTAEPICLAEVCANVVANDLKNWIHRMRIRLHKEHLHSAAIHETMDVERGQCVLQEVPSSRARLRVFDDENGGGLHCFSVCVATPNDPKLRDSGVRRGSCAAGLRGAANVTHGAVLCSAWLGDVGAACVIMLEQIESLARHTSLMPRSWCDGQ